MRLIDSDRVEVIIFEGPVCHSAWCGHESCDEMQLTQQFIGDFPDGWFTPLD